jgi:hypothetical protein
MHMDQVSQTEFLQKLGMCDVVIGYTLLPYEIAYTDIEILKPFPEIHIQTPQDATSDPFVFADSCIERFQTLKVYMLIPGTMFDVYGNRRGKGGGWYDRCLSKVPREWLRIGITDSSCFLQEKIPTNPWDEKMDWVLVKSQDQNTYTFHPSRVMQ